ncbi:HSP20 family molecular chaperone IbpA [Microvirga lupini]|uniref:HSP20 family molecular chaperone IbpA n=1 Tax=Microvirga lupini TaxID=420324 RepID=A0A7W4VLQ4_9HYPH|nr:HSP20 family molecular chaperone IbpA [Microvirga lupini]
MRTFDFSPLYRSTVGFDRLFDMLDQTARGRADDQLAALQHREGW